MVQVKAETINYSDIQKEFGYIPIQFLTITEMFLIGNHWQNGRGWIGWEPERTTADGQPSQTAATDWMRLERNFTPKNVIAGIVNRLVGAIMGKQPDWNIQSVEPIAETTDETTPPLTPNQQFFKDMDSKMVDWWDKKKAHHFMKKFLFNRGGYGKAAIRIYIPAGYFNDAGSLETTNIDEILDKIYIDVPSFGAFKDINDPLFGESFVCVCFKTENGQELGYEISYVGLDGKTHIRQANKQDGTTFQDTKNGYGVMRDGKAQYAGNESQVRQSNQYSKEITTVTPFNQDNDSNVSGQIDVDLGGNNLCYVHGEYTEALISEPVHRQQRQVNHAKTMEGYAMLNINFPETIFFNANMTEDYQDSKGITRQRTMTPRRGAGYWLSLVGIKYGNADGSETITTPTVNYREPADPQKFAIVAENNTRDMHQETGMLYIHLIDSPYPSGDARVEAMTDYIILLVDSKTIMDTLGVWLLTTVLRLALNFANKQELINEFETVFQSNITIGKLSNEDKTVMQAEVAEGLRTKRNYMIVAETTDNPDSDLIVIKADQAEKAAKDLKNATDLANATNPTPAPKATGQGA